jgi:hypothetical protein
VFSPASLKPTRSEHPLRNTSTTTGGSAPAWPCVFASYVPIGRAGPWSSVSFGAHFGDERPGHGRFWTWVWNGSHLAASAGCAPRRTTVARRSVLRGAFPALLCRLRQVISPATRGEPVAEASPFLLAGSGPPAFSSPPRARALPAPARYIRSRHALILGST